MSVPELSELPVNEPPAPAPSAEGSQESEGTDPIDAFLDFDVGKVGSTGTEEASEETFYDASKVPPELRPSFQEMQAGFTKKTQELAELRKKYERDLQGVDGLKQKAYVMDQLLQNEKFLEFLNTVDQQPGMNGQEDSSVDSSVRTHLDRSLSPVHRRLEDLERRFAAGQELAQLAVKRPDYVSYQEGILEAMKKNPNRTLEDAYNAAVVARVEERRQALAKKKAAGRSKVEGQAPALRTTPVAEVKDIHDAFALARQMIGITDVDLGRLSMSGR